MRPKGTEEFVYMAVEMGCIEARSDGTIWRVARRYKSKLGNVSVTPVAPRRIDGAISGGYRLVKVMIDGRQVTALAHRLVYRHFVGRIPGGLTINHKNGNKQDNRPSNLELATYAEQSRHAREVLKVGRLDQSGEANVMAKLTDAEVARIRARRANGEKLTEIAKDFGVAIQTVSRIARGSRRA